MTLIASAIDTLRHAAELNLEDPLRNGSLLRFNEYVQVVMTGDMHGHRRNFEKLVRYSGLRTAAARFVILQELIHEDVQAMDQTDMSHELLLAAARWKCEFPDQVFILQSNHEVAQITGKAILKAGRAVLDDFVTGIKVTYGGQAAPEVLEAIETFIESFPLAARTPNDVFIAHSLPSAREMDRFDPSVLNRRITREDLDDGPAARFLWGRRHPPELIERLAEMLDVNWFILGHQPEPMGYRQIDDRALILASDHGHGVFLPIDLAKPVTMDDLVANVRKLASVA